MNKFHNNNVRSKIHKYNYARTFIIKSIITILFLLILLATKKLNFKSTNVLLEGLKRNINYEFSFVEDGKKIYNKAKSLIDKSLDGVAVFKVNKEFISPIKGSIYKKFGQDIMNGGVLSKNIGIDIKSDNDFEPKIIFNGTVTDVEQRGNKGYFVTVEKDNMQIVYGYLSEVLLTEGSIVEFGDSIGTLGTNKDGNRYLRIELYIDGNLVNPLEYIDI